MPGTQFTTVPGVEPIELVMIGSNCGDDAEEELFQKPPSIVEGHNLQPLHPAEQQWVGSHQPQQSASTPVQVSTKVCILRHLLCNILRF